MPQNVVGTRYREKSPTRNTRVVEIVGRASARETFSNPLVWKAVVVENPILPESVGRTTYLSDRTLTRGYEPLPTPAPAKA